MSIVSTRHGEELLRVSKAMVLSEQSGLKDVVESKDAAKQSQMSG